MESRHLVGSGRAAPLRNRMESRHPGGATRPTGILPVGKPANKTTQNSRAITVRNNHTPRADHALLHLKYVTYRAKNIRFATTGWAALVAPLGEAALSSLRVWRAARRDASPHRGKRQECRRQDGGSPYGRAGARPSRAEPQRARCPVPDADERADRPFYGVGWNADFLMPRIAVGSSFVKAKHLEPRSFSDAPMR